MYDPSYYLRTPFACEKTCEASWNDNRQTRRTTKDRGQYQSAWKEKGNNEREMLKCQDIVQSGS